MLRLRQVALVARDLAAAEAEIESTLGVSRCFRDPGVGVFGLHNALFPLGDTFLEIVSPIEDGTTAGRLLERRGGDGGYMVLFQTGDIDDARRRIDAAGARLVHTAEGSTIIGLHVHPRDVGGAIVSVDQSTPPQEWEWAGPEWRDFVRTDRVTEIAGVEVQAADPAAMAGRWAEVFGGQVVDAGAGTGTMLQLDRGYVRFVPISDGRGEGVAGLEVSAADPAQRGTTATACGTRITFV